MAAQEHIDAIAEPVALLGKSQVEGDDCTHTEEYEGSIGVCDGLGAERMSFHFGEAIYADQAWVITS